MNKNIFRRINRYKYLNIFLVSCLFTEILILIIKNRFYLNLLLANINDIICCIGFLLFININRKIGCVVVFMTFIISLFFDLYVMPWNFKLLIFLIKLFTTIYFIYEKIYVFCVVILV